MQPLVNFSIRQLDKIPAPFHCEIKSNHRSQIFQDLCHPILSHLPDFTAIILIKFLQVPIMKSSWTVDPTSAKISVFQRCGVYNISQSFIFLIFMHVLIVKSTWAIYQHSNRSPSFKGVGSTRFHNSELFYIMRMF